MPSIEVSGMTIQQSIDAPVTLRNTMTLSGNISTQNGIGKSCSLHLISCSLFDHTNKISFRVLGTGSVNVCNRNLSSEKGWTEVECGIGNGPMLGFKLFRTLSRLMFLNCGTVLQFTPRGISPSLISSKFKITVDLYILHNKILFLNNMSMCQCQSMWYCI